MNLGGKGVAPILRDPVIVLSARISPKSEFTADSAHRPLLE